MALLLSGGQVCVVTHGGTLRGIYEKIVGLPSKQTMANGSLSTVRVEGECMEVTTWGDVGHLEDIGYTGDAGLGSKIAG